MLQKTIFNLLLHYIFIIICPLSLFANEAVVINKATLSSTSSKEKSVEFILESFENNDLLCKVYGLVQFRNSFGVKKSEGITSDVIIPANKQISLKTGWQKLYTLKQDDFDPISIQSSRVLRCKEYHRGIYPSIAENGDKILFKWTPAGIPNLACRLSIAAEILKDTGDFSIEELSSDASISSDAYDKLIEINLESDKVKQLYPETLNAECIGHTRHLPGRHLTFSSNRKYFTYYTTHKKSEFRKRHLVDAQTGRLLKSFPGYYKHTLFTPDSNFFVSRHATKERIDGVDTFYDDIVLRESSSGDIIYEINLSGKRRQRDTNLSPDGKYITTATATDVMMIDRKSGKILYSFNFNRGGDSDENGFIIIWSPDSKYFMAGFDLMLAATGKVVHSFRPDYFLANKIVNIEHIWFSNDGKYLAINLGRGHDRNIDRHYFWDFKTRELIHVFEEYTTFSLIENYLMQSRDSDNKVRFIHFDTLETHPVYPEPIRYYRMPPYLYKSQPKYYVSKSKEKFLQVRELASSKLIYETEHPVKLKRRAISQDQKHFITISEKKFSITDLNTKETSFYTAPNKLKFAACSLEMSQNYMTNGSTLWPACLEDENNKYLTHLLDFRPRVFASTLAPKSKDDDAFTLKLQNLEDSHQECHISVKIKHKQHNNLIEEKIVDFKMSVSEGTQEISYVDIPKFNAGTSKNHPLVSVSKPQISCNNLKSISL